MIIFYIQTLSASSSAYKKIGCVIFCKQTDHFSINFKLEEKSMVSVKFVYIYILCCFWWYEERGEGVVRWGAYVTDSWFHKQKMEIWNNKKLKSFFFFFSSSLLQSENKYFCILYIYKVYMQTCFEFWKEKNTFYKFFWV